MTDTQWRRTAERELLAAGVTLRALAEALAHAKDAQDALRALPARTWATIAVQAMDLAVDVLEGKVTEARADRLACEQVARQVGPNL